jgi:hypothetical protein
MTTKYTFRDDNNICLTLTKNKLHVLSKNDNISKKIIDMSVYFDGGTVEYTFSDKSKLIIPRTLCVTKEMRGYDAIYFPYSLDLEYVNLLKYIDDIDKINYKNLYKIKYTKLYKK